jgi:Flp pilus assembly protein TadD
VRNVIILITVWIALTGTAAAQLMGRVIMSGVEQSDVLVSLQTHNGQIVHQAFTSIRGDFRVEGVSLFSLRSDNPMYLVINEDGYKPYRKHIEQLDLRGGGALITIYLEPEDAVVTTATDADGAFTVDVQQLQAQIPDAAVREFQNALEESEFGDHNRAAEHLERAVELAPDYYDAWINLGGQYDRIGRYEEAKSAYLEASRVNPAGTLAPLNLGALYYQEGERERDNDNLEDQETFLLAREWLDKAIQLDPASAAARFYLGATLYRMDLYDQAEEMLQGAITMEEERPGIRSMLINVFSRQNRYEAALEQAIAFLDENPESPDRGAIERVRSQLEGVLGR